MGAAAGLAAVYWLVPFRVILLTPDHLMKYLVSMPYVFGFFAEVALFCRMTRLRRIRGKEGDSVYIAFKVLVMSVSCVVVPYLALLLSSIIMNLGAKLWMLTTGGDLSGDISISFGAEGIAASPGLVFMSALRIAVISSWVYNVRSWGKSFWYGFLFVIREFPALFLIFIPFNVWGYLLAWYLTGEPGVYRQMAILTESQYILFMATPVFNAGVTTALSLYWYSYRHPKKNV